MPENEKKIGRREFLKWLSRLGIMGILGLAAYEITKNEKFLRLVEHSIKSGKVGEDIKEIVTSRLSPDKHLYELSELVNYRESWYEKVSSEWKIYHLGEIDTYLGTFDVTKTTKVLPTVREENQHYRYRNNDISVVYYSLPKAFNPEPGLVLPGPTYGSPYSEKYAINYLVYGLYAGYRKGENWDTSATDQKERLSRLGGLILREGVLKVATSDELKQVDIKDPKLQALMQYNFVVDSETLEQDFWDIEHTEYYPGVPTLKNQAFTMEYANCVVTLYDRNNNFRTIVVSSFSPYDEKEKTMGNSPTKLNILQLTNLVNQLAQKEQTRRFVIAFPDPSISAAMITPISFSDEEVVKKGWVYGTGGEEDWAKNFEGDRNRYYRYLGGGNEKVVTPSMEFQFVLYSRLE